MFQTVNQTRHAKIQGYFQDVIQLKVTALNAKQTVTVRLQATLLVSVESVKNVITIPFAALIPSK